VFIYFLCILAHLMFCCWRDEKNNRTKVDLTPLRSVFAALFLNKRQAGIFQRLPREFSTTLVFFLSPTKSPRTICFPLRRRNGGKRGKDKEKIK